MTAKGILRHCFWGDYYAQIGMEFDSPDCAEACLLLLPGFRQSDKNKAVLVAMMDSAKLEEFKARLADWHVAVEPCGRRDCRHQCRNEAIDSIAHSIDYGPNWTVNVPAEDVHQLHLFA